jgi:hypothetical protein
MNREVRVPLRLVSRWSALLLLSCLVLPRAAFAWPVDVYLDLRPGEERFRRLSAVEWLEVEDPGVVTAEVMESGELFFTAKAPGRTLILLYAEGKMAVWRVRVASVPPAPKPDALEAAVAPVKKLCPGLKVDLSGEAPALSTLVPDERCRLALLELFKQDGFAAKDLSLTFELAALQSQLVSIHAGIAASTRQKVQARYLGAGLVLEGQLTAREHRKVLWEIFKRTVGRPAVNDRIELTDTGSDAGTK